MSTPILTKADILEQLDELAREARSLTDELDADALHSDYTRTFAQHSEAAAMHLDAILKGDALLAQELGVEVDRLYCKLASLRQQLRDMGAL